MDILKTIQLESSTLCNGHCVFCPHFDMTRPEGEMTNTLFHKIVDEAIAMGVEMVTPFLNGEPFLFPRIFEWLDYLQAHNLKFVLFTNGSALSKERAVRLNKYKNLTDLIFSMHGYDQPSYEAQTNLSYQQVKQNIEYFATIAQVPFHVYMLDTAINHPGIDVFLKTWADFHPYYAKYNNWAGKRPASMQGTKVPCDRLLSEMTIYWDGRVNLCCMDSDAGVILGDANTQSLSDIWASNQWMRDKHRAMDFDIPLCKICNKNII
jgi:hypothetical protein